MIVVHHLNNSRSQRILWLFEEMGLEYEIVKHQRDPETRLAPPALKAIHPLGKSPVVVEDGKAIAESGAIIEYFAERHGGGRISVPEGNAARADYLFWLHYAEGSAMLPFLLALYVGRLGEAGAPLHPRIFGEIANHLSFIDGALGKRDFLVGDRFTAADVQNTFVIEAAHVGGHLGKHANLTRYLAAMHARPAYQRALERGGPYALGR
ncbi:MAG: glutathione S-transferase family protein [Hyphomonadaceae bacterium]